MARLLSASASRCRPVTPRRNSAPCIGKNPPSTHLSRRTREREPAGMMPRRPPEQRIECQTGRRWTSGRAPEHPRRAHRGPPAGYSWPGNVREPQSVLKQALLQARGTTLLPTFLPVLPGEPFGPPAADDPNLEAFIRLCLNSDQADLYAEAHRQIDPLLLPRDL